MERSRETLRQNLVVTADGHCYTRPAPMTYEQQWLWDSCFHAIVNTHLDLELAQAEKETSEAPVVIGPPGPLYVSATTWSLHRSVMQ